MALICPRCKQPPTAGPRCEKHELVALPEEVGQSMRDLDCGLVVRLYRGGEPVGFWESGRNVIERDDLLLIIQPSG